MAVLRLMMRPAPGAELVGENFAVEGMDNKDGSRFDTTVESLTWTVLGRLAQAREIAVDGRLVHGALQFPSGAFSFAMPIRSVCGMT